MVLTQAIQAVRALIFEHLGRVLKRGFLAHLGEREGNPFLQVAEAERDGKPLCPTIPS